MLLWNVLDFSLDPEVVLTEIFLGFPQVLQEIA